MTKILTDQEEKNLMYKTEKGYDPFSVSQENLSVTTILPIKRCCWPGSDSS